MLRGDPDHVRKMENIKKDGFDWRRFKEFFPLGDLETSEGEYVELLECSLNSLPEKYTKGILLDMLDIQWLVYLEQINIIEELTGDNKVGERHFISARIEIDSSMRWRYDLPRKDVRKAHDAMVFPETLVDRFTGKRPEPIFEDEL